ncbi:MAG TPA: outer membrane beta-barrel protein [Kofleriaceae bacterium]|nr:outer membrane beta-barrel protein [Kofleriaceae bacterium]
MTKTLGALVFVAAVAAPNAASADDNPSVFSYSWRDNRMQSGIGVSALLGAGVSGFTDATMRDVAAQDVGGLWDLRVAIGSHIPLGLELAYIGTAVDIDALTGTQTGTLIGTTAEAALRYNIMPQYKWNPYVFAGIGYQRYDVRNGNFTLSDTGVSDSDNSIVFPLGAGLSYRDTTGLVFDLRGELRANTNQGLVLDTNGVDYVPMHAWEASGAIGYEF